MKTFHSWKCVIHPHEVTVYYLYHQCLYSVQIVLWYICLYYHCITTHNLTNTVCHVVNAHVLCIIKITSCLETMMVWWPHIVFLIYVMNIQVRLICVFAQRLDTTDIIDRADIISFIILLSPWVWDHIASLQPWVRPLISVFVATSYTPITGC